MPRCVDRVSQEVGTRMPARSVCLVTLSLSEARPASAASYPSQTSTMPCHTANVKSIKIARTSYEHLYGLHMLISPCIPCHQVRSLCSLTHVDQSLCSLTHVDQSLCSLTHVDQSSCSLPPGAVLARCPGRSERRQRTARADGFALRTQVQKR